MKQYMEFQPVVQKMHRFQTHKVTRNIHIPKEGLSILIRMYGMQERKSVCILWIFLSVSF